MKIIDALRHAWAEERLVRNWGEGLVGDLAPELRSLVETLRHSEGSEISGLFDGGLCEVLLGRLRQCPPAVERVWIERALVVVYASCTLRRSSLRLLLGSEVFSFKQAPRWRWAIAPVLGVLRSILDAVSEQRDASLSASAAGALLERVLLPLWLPSDFAEWRAE